MRDLKSTSRAKRAVLAYLVLTFALLALPRVASGLERSNRVESGAASYLDSWRWSRFTGADGLPDSPILSMKEVGDGILAVTHNDVLLYDGWKWTPLSPPVSYILSLDVDEDGSIWIGANEGLFRGTTDEPFARIAMPAPYDSARVMSVIAHPDGGVALVASSSRIRGWRTFRYDGEFLEMPGPSNGEWASIPPSFYSTRERALIASGDKLLTYRNGFRTLLEVDVGEIGIRCSDVNAGGDGIVGFRVPRSLMGVWEISPEFGIRRVESEGKGVVRAAAISEVGEAVVVYESGDVRLRDEGEWQSLHPVPAPFLSALSLMYTAGGDLWVASTGEIHVFRQSNSFWSQHRDPEVNSPCNQVHDLISTRSGAILAATSGGIVTVGERSQSRSRSVRTIERLPVPEVPNGELISSIREAADGRIWGCGADGFPGAAVWDGEQWTVISEDDSGRPLPPFLHVQTDARGEVWFTNHRPSEEQPAVYRLTPDGIRPYEEVGGFGNRPTSGVIEDEQGRLWVATSEGISRRESDGVWKDWTFAEDWNGYVRFIEQGPDGRVWFGARGLHVGWIGTDDELTIDRSGPYEVRDIGFGEDGRVWCVSLVGLSQYESDGWQFFDPTPHLSSTQFECLLLLRDSILVSSSSSGLHELSSSIHVVPPPKIEIRPPVVDSDRLQVDWDVYSWWGAKPTAQIQTRTSVDGGPWSEWSTSRRLVLAHPSTGDHEVRVQTHSPSGELRTASAAVRVERPSYANPLVVATVVGLLLTIGWLGFGMFRQRARGRKALEASERLFRGIAEQSREIVWLGEIDSDRLVYLNPAGQQIWSVGSGMGEPLRSRSQWREQVEVEDRDAVAEHHAAVARGIPGELEYRLRRDGGNVHWVRERAFPLRNTSGRLYMIASLIEDVTDRHHKEESRRNEEERQRTAIVQEVHHRVKNTLQGVVGLLENQIHEKPETRDALESSILQINAVATVHGLESKSGRVRVTELVKTIARHVRMTLQCDVTIRDLVQEPSLALASGEGVPIALVLNEVVFNAARHRAPDSAGVEVHLSRTGAAVTVQVRNQGKLPQGFDLESGATTGTGLNLVRLLIPKDKVWLQISQVGDDVYSRLTISGDLIFGPGERGGEGFRSEQGAPREDTIERSSRA